MERTTIGARLRRARGLRALTQAELADLTGISRNTVSRLENDVTPLSARHAVALAQGLGVDLEWLLVGPGDFPVPAEKVAS